MSEKHSIDDICRQIRFFLDEPAAEVQSPDVSLPDMVARVRSTGLLVTSRTVPAVHRIVEMISENLGIAPPEVYVVNSPSANAFAPAFAEFKRPIIVLNSGLITLLSPSELVFPVGHEIGHLCMRHAQQATHGYRNSEFEALQFRSTQRYAEISADRVGLIACRSVFIAARVMVKLASGLSSEYIDLDIDAFVRQMERDPQETNRSWELHESHPSLPLRLWALIRFSHSRQYNELVQLGEAGYELQDVDDEVARRFEELGDGRLSEMESSVYRLGLLWTAAAMIIEDEKIELHERIALAKMVGNDDSKKAIAFAEAQGRTAVIDKLMEAIARINSGSRAMRKRFYSALQSFCMAARIQPDKTEAGRYLKQFLNMW